VKLKSVLKVEDFDKLDEPVKAFYLKRADGMYELDADVEESTSVRGLKSAFEKEKEESKKARGARKALMEKLGIEDSDEADAKIEALLALQTEAEKVRGKKMLDEGKVQELVNEQVAAMKKDHDKQILKLTGERDTYRTTAERAMVDGALQSAAVAAGVKKTALLDVLLRGKQVYRLDGGNVVAFDGDKQKFSKDGQTPLAMGEWLEGLREEAGHLFEPSTGGGANGGVRAVAGGAFQLSREQARDPAAYRATKEAATKAGKDVTIQQAA
jgi:hypothetical protein